MSKKKSKLGIKILEIKEVSFSNKITDELVSHFKEENFSYQIGISVRGDEEKNTIILGAMVSFLLENDNTKQTLSFIKLQTENIFELFNVDDRNVEYNEDNEIFISDELMSVFLTTSFGALRGMLAYKMASLPINLVLPLVDASYFLKNYENANKKEESK